MWHAGSLYEYRTHTAQFLVLVAGLIGCASALDVVYAQPYVATTTVSLTVCGDGIVEGSEFCDDGDNVGGYANSIAGRKCNACIHWDEYCGDAELQTFFGEQCDTGNNFSGDGDNCNAVCQNETTPVVEGGGSGGSTSGGGGGRSSGGDEGIEGAVEEGTIPFEGETELVVRGSAYPGATITVLRDGDIERVVEAGSDASFDFTLTGQTPGISTFGFWALDRAGRKSITYTATFQIIKNAVTTLTGILVPPTLVALPEKVAPGGTVSFEGSAAPDAQVQIYLDASSTPARTVAAGSGEYRYAHDTTGMTTEVFHTVKANYIDADNSELKSGYSQLVQYYVGTGDPDTTLTADLNKDGSVNLTDFSILLFNWNTSATTADINGDGTVSLPDFSIMLFYWTG
jgi:cysteine-rich repeat protein